MKIAEYKQIDSRIVVETVMVDDIVNGEIVGQHQEMISKQIPIMGMVYRDCTSEQEAAAITEQDEIDQQFKNEPTIEEKFDALVNYLGLTIENVNGVLEVIKK